MTTDHTEITDWSRESNGNGDDTIRAVPLVVDRALRRRAREEDRSVNAVAIEALARGLDLDRGAAGEHADLDALIGSW